MWLCVSVITWKVIIISVRMLHRPNNHTYSESLWWKLFKNHKRTQIQRQRQWQRQRQRQRHRESAWKTQHMLHFLNPDYSLIPNMMIYTSSWSSCSRQSLWSPWSLYSVHTINSTGPSESPCRDFLNDIKSWRTLHVRIWYAFYDSVPQNKWISNQFVKFYVPNNYDVQQPIRNYE